MSSPSLAARVRKFFAGDIAPRLSLDLDIEVAPGITILFGPSGAGKSTLLDCIAGLTQPDAGRISIDGEAFFDSEKKVNLSPQQRRIAYVFQTLALFPHMTVEGNVAYGLANAARQKSGALVAEILQMFRVEALRGRKRWQRAPPAKHPTAVTRPDADTVAMLVFEDVHVDELVTSCVALLDSVAVAVSCDVAPDDAGEAPVTASIETVGDVVESLQAQTAAAVMTARSSIPAARSVCLVCCFIPQPRSIRRQLAYMGSTGEVWQVC